MRCIPLGLEHALSGYIIHMNDLQVRVHNDMRAVRLHRECNVGFRVKSSIPWEYLSIFHAFHAVLLVHNHKSPALLHMYSMA